MPQSIYQHPMNEHSTWIETLEGYISHQSMPPFSPPLSDDPFSRSSSSTFDGDLQTYNAVGQSRYFTGNTDDLSMFSMAHVQPPATIMPYLPMRLNADPTPLPFAIEEEDESQSETESQSTIFVADDTSSESEGPTKTRLKLLRRSLSSLSATYARHTSKTSTSPSKKAIRRIFSMHNMSKKLSTKNN
ncbi:hypothetical protein CVT24_000021 [Panaeolus cyanescens]|uniref:Uncharacterized protein n=1 Tax=Panaeolus cyanescens TaxID=181874 RepID=A0A409VSH8_9AGAR|nr:hypothetical protein CVT24_000021 [Panaeolus cyanescens]